MRRSMRERGVRTEWLIFIECFIAVVVKVIIGSEKVAHLHALHRPKSVSERREEKKKNERG
jgi:hypothetical protein